ncbi:MAG: S8 family serine peptidase [Candidatus Geothermarchaeales archaeon]
MDNFYAGNGDLVAFMGPFGGSHGTMVASQIVGQGNALYGRARGVAPDAKIIAIGMIPEWDTVNSAYFSVEGYDGVPGTGDEANIMSNSWGYTASVTGWEFDDRFFDWLATNYSKGNTSITFSAGNDGSGYGTVTSPSAPGIIMVGGAQQFFYRVLPEELTRSFDGGPSPMGGDTWYGASRGPTATGQFGTDVVSAASFVHVSVPLNTFGPDFDGFAAIDFVSGTSFSSPAAAGVLALAYDAYRQRTGEFPDTYTVKAVLMSGSEDMDSDVIVQGAGYINALRSTNVAGGLGGAFVTPYNWIPGDYRGDRYDVFARLMEPGESEVQTFTVNNTNGAAVDYDIAGETVAKFGEVNYTYNPSDLLQPAGRYGSGSLFYVLNETGIWDLYTHSLVQAIDPALWNDAELLRITEAIPQADYPGSFYLEVHRFTEGIVNDDWKGHTDEVRAVDISPDGTMMASAGADGKIFVVDTSTSEIIWELDHPGPVGLSGSFNTFDVKFASNSTWLVASFGDFNISIWDVSSGSLVNTLTAPAEVIAIDLSPNGTWMVAGQWDANVTIWNIISGTMVGIWNQTFAGPVNDVAFSPNGTWVASLDYGWWEVDLWNVTTLVQEDQFDVEPNIILGYPMAVEFNPTNGQEVAFATKYGWYLRSLGFPEGAPGPGFPDVAVYDIGTGTYTGWWAGHMDVVKDISWSDDGSKIASASGFRPDLGGDDNSVKVWDSTQNDTMLENVQKFLDFVNKVDFAPGGISFAAADDEGVALVVDTTDSGMLEYTVTTALVNEFDNGIWYERNRQVTSFTNNVVEAVRVHDPAARDPEGIIIWTRDAGSSSVDTTVTVTVEFYKKATWSWLSLDSTMVSVPGDGTATFNATVEVPSDAAVGTYEAAIYLRNATLGDIVVPVMVNVLGKSPIIEFGGNLLTSDLYDNNRLYTWDGTNGDRRYYFFDVEDSFVFRDGMKLLVDINMTFKDSYGDIRHYQQAKRGEEIVGPDDRYGPFVLEETDVGAPGLFKKSLDWQDQGNGLVKGLTVGPGLNLLEVQGAILDGSTFYETIEGRTGLMTFNPYPVEIYTNSLTGQAENAMPLTLTSTMAWAANPDPFDPNYGKAMAVTVAGAETEVLQDLVVFQDDPDDHFTSSFVKKMVLEDIVSIVFHVEGQPVDDIDLFVHFDSNENGVLDTTDDLMGSSTTPTAIETVSLLLPQDGLYFILVHGWSIPAGVTTFDMTIDTLVTGVAPVELAGIPDEVKPNQPTTTLLEWSLPSTQADGDVIAAFFVSPGVAPISLALLVPVTVHLDREEPTISDFAPAPGATVVDQTPSMLVSLSDTNQLDKDSFKMLLDGVDITGLVSVAIPFSGGGYFSGVATYTPAKGLAEGSHLIEVEIADLAGNLAQASWAFTIDTTGPFLTVTSPAEGLVTASDSLTISGETEPGSAVTVAAQAVHVDSQGTFSAIVTLSPGINSIEIISTDPAGNSVTTTRIVTFDTVAPSISQVRSSAGLVTNEESTIISGSVDEEVSLIVAGTPAIVHADGTFDVSVTLVEGANTISVVATDLAGNAATQTLTVTRDTAPPVLAIDTLPGETSDATITISGTVESGIAFVTVNGQPVPVSGGQYSTEVALSFGPNEIFVEATDAAGNTKTVSASISFVPTGVTVASVGLILLPVLTVVGLLLGLALGPRVRPRPPKEEVAPPLERPEKPKEGGQ